MSVQAMSWVLDNSEAKAGDRLVLLALANHAGKDSWSCWPSVDTLARESRMGERGTRYALRRLEDADRIAAVGRDRSGTTIYRILTTAEVDAVCPRHDLPPADDDTQGGKTQHEGGHPGAPEPSRGTITNHQDDDASASAPRTVPAIWPPVAATLQRVPEWAAALMRGADIACLTIIESNTDAPWPQIAAAAVSSRLDPDAGINTNSPRQALDMLLNDHRAGRGTGSAARGVRRNGRQQTDAVDHYASMRGTLG